MDDAVAESGREWRPLGSTRYSLGMENEWADAGRDGRIFLVAQISQAQTGADRKKTKNVHLTKIKRKFGIV